MTDFSVVVCTYNGERRLPALLERLRSQIIPQGLTWEILIVDNNSHDQTAQYIRSQPWSYPNGTLRYLFEPRQGLAYARRCAIKNVSSDLVGFLDDDTLPSLDWVAQAYDFAQRHPQVGAYGSAIHGEYESQPPQGFERIASCLAVIQRGDTPFQYSSGLLPAGAGMVIRRHAWLGCVPAEPALSGVCGTSLSAKGEDIETLSHIRQRGWPIWHNPSMRLTHVIPARRLRPAYLLSLFQSIGTSRYSLRRLRYRQWQRPMMMLLHGVNDLRKLLKHVVQTRQLYPTDIVIACERTLLIHSLVSPVYGWFSQAAVTRLNAMLFRKQLS
ncbi:MAG: hormogonium polysaccharide biosynthesis glycosyltransferase HpsE [Cyanobacteria bacterium P01_D01_bin.56]